MELHPCDFDLESLLQDVKVIFTIPSQEKGLQLNFKGLNKNEKVFVHSDSIKLRQILVNLIGNAIKFTHSGSVTLIIQPQKNDNYYFEVRDTGAGIPMEKQASIFKAFQQDEEGIKQGGTGLGLPISKKLLKLLGSDLKMESILQEGSRFFFTLKLPSARTLDELDDNAYTTVSQLAFDYKVKAVLIDDVQANLDVLARVLENIGVECKVADNGRDGLQLVDDFSPDIVFSDYHMAGVDGLEVTRRIRKKHVNSQIKIVMISASVFTYQQKIYREEGVNGFIGKPFVREEIFEILVDLLGVEYQYGDIIDHRPKEQKLLGLDISSINLPKELLTTIKNAAQSGQISKVNELIEYLENENLMATNLIKHLKDLTDKLELDSVFDIFSKIRSDE